MNTNKNDLRNFIIFFIGQSLSQFGSTLTSFAIVIWAFTTTGKVMTSSMLAVCNTIPYLFVSLFGGSVVDRKNKKTIMLICDLIAALSTLVIIICLQLNSMEIWILYIINAISGLMNAFQNPASQVVITMLVEKQNFVKFGGLQTTVNSMLSIFAPIMATGLISIGGLEIVLIIDLCTFLFAFLTLLFLVKIPEKKLTNDTRFWDVVLDIKNGIMYLKKQKGILYLMIIYSSLNFIGAISFDSMMSPLILARTNNNTLSVGIVSAMIAISGTLAGIVITFSKQSDNKIKVMFRGILVAFIGIMSFGLVNNIYLWSLVVLVGCFGMPFYFAYESAILREYTPIEMQGKLFAMKGMLAQILTPCGYFLGAVLADYVFEPLMLGNNRFRNIFVRIVGTGKGSGISLLFVFAGLLGIILTLLFRNNKNIKSLDINRE